MADALCQVCGDAIRDERVYCTKCHSPHHRDCWDFNEGCSIFACGGRECWHVDPRGDSASEVVYIDETRTPPSAERQRRVYHGAAGNWFVFLSMIAVCIIRGMDADPTPPVKRYRKPSTVRPRHARPIEPSSLLKTASPLGVAQTIRDSSDLARGELVFLTKETPVEVPIPGLNIQGTRFTGITESGRFVTLGRGDFELLPNQTRIYDMSEAPAVLRTLRLSVVPLTFQRYVILVDPASQSSELAPGTIIQVDRVEMGPDGPAAYHGLSHSGEVTVPAISCRPLLSPTLRSEALQ